MSYYFQMAFANAKTEVEAYSIAHSFVNGISLEQMKAYIDDSFLFVPSVKYSMGKKLKDKTFSDLADKYWLYGLFNYRFVFWPKFHLLGLLGSSENTSFSRVISFQNSTDQDYDWDEWPNNIPYFKERVFATKQALKNGNTNFWVKTTTNSMKIQTSNTDLNLSYTEKSSMNFVSMTGSTAKTTRCFVGSVLTESRPQKCF